MQQGIYFDAWDEACKTPFGAVREGETLCFRFQVDSQLSATRVCLKFRPDGTAEEQQIELLPVSPADQYTTYQGVFSVANRGLYFYRFEITTPEGIRFVGRGDDARAVVGDFLPEWQLTVYDKAFSTPANLNKGIMYQIFPDRFCRSGKTPLPPARGGRTLHHDWLERPLFKADVPDYIANDFFGGNLEGILGKLPYLKSLGVTLLYLNPIFEAAANHRYNTGDYLAVDPWLGNAESFQILCQKAETLGIRVILDGVFSHTGSDSRYFNRDGHYDSVGAWQSPDSIYAPWYHFKDDERKEYDCWWGFRTLPNVNEVEPSFLRFICGEGGVLDYWMARGAGGWRLDVADELPEAFLDAVRARIKAHSPDAYLLGEVWEDASNKESYGVRRRYLLGQQLDGVMNYPWRTAVLAFVRGGDAALFYRRILTLLDHYPHPAVQALMNPLSTHDVARAATELGVLHSVESLEQGNYRPTAEEQKRGCHRLKLAALLQYTLPGYPSLYYGDEAGLFGFSDPWNRCCYPWGKENAKLLEFFRTLGAVRTAHPADLDAPLRFAIHAGAVTAYWRGKMLTAINRSEQEIEVSLPTARSKLLLSVGNVRLRHGRVLLPPDSGCLLRSSADAD